MWGDPHVITCDGIGYDCNAQGIFTVMKNFLYHIQGHFTPVGAVGMAAALSWGKYPKVTIATEFVIDNVQNDDIPVMQFSFPEFFSENGLPLEEQGCMVNFIYAPTLEAHTAPPVDDLQECRKLCEGTEGCVHFHFGTGSKHCHMSGADALLQEKPNGWSRTVAGHVQDCGHPAKYEGRGVDDDKNAYLIGNDIKYEEEHICPLLYYEDGELQDISLKADGDFLYGDANSDTFVQLYDRNKIKIVTKTAADSISEIMLEAAGKGPGELFGCHWNIFVCLPRAEKTAFKTSQSLGLMGTPDGKKWNDWMDVTGETIDLPNVYGNGVGKQGQEAYDYCSGK